MHELNTGYAVTEGCRPRYMAECTHLGNHVTLGSNSLLHMGLGLTDDIEDSLLIGVNTSKCNLLYEIKYLAYIAAQTLALPLKRKQAVHIVARLLIVINGIRDTTGLHEYPVIQFSIGVILGINKTQNCFK